MVKSSVLPHTEPSDAQPIKNNNWTLRVPEELHAVPDGEDGKCSFKITIVQCSFMSTRMENETTVKYWWGMNLKERVAVDWGMILE